MGDLVDGNPPMMIGHGSLGAYYATAIDCIFPALNFSLISAMRVVNSSRLNLRARAQGRLEMMFEAHA
jgi:hypothetical protein